MAKAVSLSEVQKAFAGGVIALDSFDLDIAPQEFVSIVGPSGCGKSTLLRLVAGLDTAYTGTIAVDGQAVREPNPAIGFVFQEPRLFPWRTVAKNIAFGSKSATGRNERIAHLLTEVGLSGSADQLPRQLSGGMAQRVAIARALISEPDVLLMDEPFSALDAFTRMRLQDVVLSVWQRHRPTTIMVTHDIDEAIYLSDRVIVLTERPGHVHHIMNVDLTRPRDRRDPRFAELRATLLTELDIAFTA